MVLEEVQRFGLPAACRITEVGLVRFRPVVQIRCLELTGTSHPVTQLRFTALAFRVLGLLVILVGILHLYATRLILTHVLSRIDDARLRSFIAPGYLLDHLVVGVLMLPIGFNMFWSAAALGRGQRWAWVSNVAVSLSILSTPFLIALLMGAREMHSPIFVVAAVLMAFIGIVGTSLLFLVRKACVRRDE